VIGQLIPTPEASDPDVREFTERHREMRTLYRDYRDIADVVNQDMDDSKVDSSESEVPRDAALAPGSEITAATEIVILSIRDRERERLTAPKGRYPITPHL
jgi:hypothetical protein